MLLSITTTRPPATDLGYLLGKHPDGCRTYDVAHGQAHIVYPTADADRCAACLLLDIDPIGLVRHHRGGPDDPTLARYVNDRPYRGLLLPQRGDRAGVRERAVGNL